MKEFPERPLRLGTRGSPMAIAQTRHVAALLGEIDPHLWIETVPTMTEADAWQGELAQLGGKGLFVKAVDALLQRGEVDVAVHCLKDVPGDQPLPQGLVFAATLPRADVRDVLVVPAGSTVTSPSDLHPGSTVATSSVRRRAQLLALRPDLDVVPVRGAVGSRLAKLDGDRDGLSADALVLARAGLERLGLAHRIRHEFSVGELLPAVGAGVLVLECRADDTAVAALLERLNHPTTQAEAAAERAMLRGLRGHCNSPIAGYCVTEADGRLSMRGMVFTADGSQFAHARLRSVAPHDPVTLGSRVCAELLRTGARSMIDGTARS